MRMPKRSTAVLTVAALVALCGAMPPPAAADPPSWANGRAAVARLGSRLDGVARPRHGLSSAQLRSNLLHDPSLFVDSADELLYVDAVAPQAGAAQTAVAAAANAVDPSTAFSLHSRPGSRRVIYLDFDGQTITGTGWNGNTGGTC